uniref:Uncharacterized protein n=1 Tax=Anguilla anguilla TaxID=7936 RepID=A0A0E9SCY4_ANGAN
MVLDTQSFLVGGGAHKALPFLVMNTVAAIGQPPSAVCMLNDATIWRGMGTLLVDRQQSSASSVKAGEKPTPATLGLFYMLRA